MEEKSALTPEALNKMFGLYLTCSYAYYKMDISLIPDDKYDALCKKLHEHYDDITHKYKLITTPDDFAAGTGFAIRYPEQLERAIVWYINQQTEK